jgi:ABC-type antimicrobial peptide transport system permease subunit
MLMESPFYPVRKSIYMIETGRGNVLNVRINPNVRVQEALSEIEHVFKKYSPEVPFEYSFVDQDYARKFSEEESIGTLAFIFAALAVFISCLGIFGLASFVAEQRTKEIGIRKVLGASVTSVWRMLSKEFVLLVVLACALAVPISWYFLDGWLQQYDYKTKLSWWIFAITGAGALAITLMTVSFQSVKAALANPVKSLRSE